MSTLHRSRSKEQEYRKYLKGIAGKGDVCVFCDEQYYEVIEDHTLLRVINNLFPYTLWDSCAVTEHIMLVPKRHIHSVSEYTQDEVIESHAITATYERQGYDVFSRGQSSTMKSVLHQHTHLIKTDGKKISGLIYNETPLVHITY